MVESVKQTGKENRDTSRSNKDGIEFTRKTITYD